MTFEKCCTCKHVFTTGKNWWYCKKSLADKDDCGEYAMKVFNAKEVNDIFDKIRAEIKALLNANPSYWHSGDMVEREEVLDIIDKYKTESEDKE